MYMCVRAIAKIQFAKIHTWFYVYNCVDRWLVKLVKYSKGDSNIRVYITYHIQARFHQIILC